ncbi:MAG TPA: hypothetical protein VFA12_20545 [Stellaceae bacterium]|nr:hypothetical protein [Stellaceae bacterium]
MDLPPHPLIAEVEAFLYTHRMTPTAFGRDALGDPTFVFEIREGRECRRSTVKRAREQMARYAETGEFKDPRLLRAEDEAA